MEQETLQLFSSYDETTGHWDTVPSTQERPANPVGIAGLSCVDPFDKSPGYGKWIAIAFF